MFACFGLKRLDIFSTGDLAVQRGMAALMGKDVNKLKAKGAKNKWKYLSEKEMEEIAEKFRPYRYCISRFGWAPSANQTSQECFHVVYMVSAFGKPSCFQLGLCSLHSLLAS
jgi:3-methyladenine DNA glycosylase/8-oxoguanine DNA glycosylase